MTASRITGRAEQDRQVAALFGRISDSFERNNRAWSRVVAPAFREALKPARAEIRRLTPKDSGRLRRSITTAADSRRRTVQAGYRHVRGAPPRYPQMLAVEFGLKRRRYKASAPVRTAWRKAGIDEASVARLMARRLETFLASQAVAGLTITRG